MATKWTSDQEKAIYGPTGSVIVSAAAGSGKTAVLVERIINMITRKDNPVDADRLLVATFSNAAAQELRERIEKRLASMLVEDKNNQNLIRQQMLLKKANISTIHSFCLTLLQENAELLGIDSSFRIADDSEMAILEVQAVDKVMQDGYASNEPEFMKLVEVYLKKDDTNLQKDIIDIYEFIRSFPHPKEWLNNQLEVYKISDIDKAPWRSALIERIKERVEYCAQRYLWLSRKASDENHLSYSEIILSDKQKLDELLEVLQTGSWDDICNFSRLIKFATWSADKTLPKEISDEYKKNRNSIKDSFTRICSKYFVCTSDDYKQDTEYLYPIVKRLFKAVEDYYDELERLKAEKSIVDFTDLELYAIKLLSKKTESGYVQSDIAKNLSEQFEEIFLDEYQDTNAAQDSIFSLISKNGNGENIFVVGDVKQSIYGFRSAMPQIFNDKKNSSVKYDGENFPARIDLSANFRSRKNVTGFVNFLFSQIMSENLGDVCYDDAEKLDSKREFLECPNTATELHIVDVSNMEKDEYIDAEAEHIAKTIKDMIKNNYLVEDGDELRSCEERDFCILLRSTKKSQKYIDALRKYGCNGFSDNSSGYFENPEILVLINLLKIIDNPLDDIAFLSVVMAPPFAFTPDEVACARLNAKNIPLYSAFLEYAKQSDKAKSFIEQLAYLREKSVLVGVKELLNEIFDSTELFAVYGAMHAGVGKQANLRVMYHYVNMYEIMGQNGLSGFVRYIDKMIESDKDFKGATLLNSENDVVKIMSIHKSKGLEFPICILADCSRNFNKQDAKGDILLHRKYGVATKVIIPQRLASYPTLYHIALSGEIDKDNTSEEMRILYVALTRAKHKLIVSCPIKDKDKLEKYGAVCFDKYELPVGMLVGANSYSDWIIPAAMRHKSADELRKLAGFETIPLDSDWEFEVKIAKQKSLKAQKTKTKTARKAEASEEIIANLSANAEYVYPYESVSRCVKKLAVTQLVHGTDKTKVKIKARPKFMEREGITPAERGTITHKFMQFADFENAVSDLDAEIERLLNADYFSSYEIEALNKAKLKAFFSSELMKNILSAEEVYREYDFFDEIPASEVYPENDGIAGENILIQGIADCIIVKNGVVTIIDYKTDYLDNESEFVALYKKQLDIYERTIKKEFSVDSCNKVIYSLHLEKEINL